MTTRKKPRASARPSLKNTYSQSPRVFEDIQKTLRDHKARSVTLNYDEGGHVAALSFVLEMSGRWLQFRLPARYENVERIFVSRKGRSLTAAEREQAYRTAWANVRDLLAAQMAFLDTEMAEAAEIFLPYLLNQEGVTYFEALKERQFFLDLPRPSLDEA